MVTIKAAAREDCAFIAEMIRELAVFEHLEDQVTVTAADIENLIFEEKVGRGLIAKWDGRPAGYCLYFYNISTSKVKKVFISRISISAPITGEAA